MANNNGPLDKFRVKQPSGQRIIKAGFNPGRNASWDWNELLTTIEANFESDFDLAALEANVQANKVTGSTNATNIATNTEDIGTNTTAIATKATTASVTALNATVEALTVQLSANLEKVAAICACLTAAEIECAACER